MSSAMSSSQILSSPEEAASGVSNSSIANTQSKDLALFFRQLDSSFIKYDSSHSEPIVWSAKDYLVQISREVKVPVEYGSTVQFEFFTTQGDIKFEVLFISSESNSVETIREASREPSDIETITGSYKADSAGVFIFKFDNSFSWFTDKYLTYTIKLIQPVFTTADTLRANQSRRYLNELQQETKDAQEHLSQCKIRNEETSQEIIALEQRLQALLSDLEYKKAIIVKTKNDIDNYNRIIKINKEKSIGLSLRCLEKKLLCHTLSFLGKEEGPYLTCKYWKSCIDQNEANSN